ncbi:hypothetical protein Droror1_Dr00001023 [Drosera rotundifolia]
MGCKGGGYGHLVLSYNIHTEVFKCIVSPYHGDPHDRLQLLAIIGDESFAFVDVCIWSGYCTIWVMEEHGDVESWRIVGPGRIKLAKGALMHIKRNGELLLARGQYEVRSYNIFMKNVKVFPVNRPDQQSRTATYIESLMLHTQGIDCSSSAKDQPEPP